MDFIKKNFFILFLFIIFTASLLFYYCYVSTGFWEFSRSADDWAKFGSYSAGIFTGITFLAVIYQLYLLRKSQEKQDFERTFFMMLEHHNNKLRILESLQFKKQQSLVDVFYGFILSGHSIDDTRKKFIEYDRFFSEMDSYFLNLYRILKYIYKNKEFNLDNEYSILLRSFLSRKILLILAFHLCKREEQYKKYIELVNQFSFFEHLDIDTVEFNFLSQITGLDSKLIREQFKEYQKNRSSFYPDEYGDPSTYIWGDSQTERISTPIILSIFEGKYNHQKIAYDDFMIADFYYKYFGKVIGIDPETYEDIYELDHPLDQGIENKYIKNIFIYILYTFSPDAFSSEQKNKFENLQKIYENLSNKLEQLEK